MLKKWGKQKKIQLLFCFFVVIFMMLAMATVANAQTTVYDTTSFTGAVNSLGSNYQQAGVQLELNSSINEISEISFSLQFDTSQTCSIFGDSNLQLHVYEANPGGNALGNFVTNSPVYKNQNLCNQITANTRDDVAFPLRDFANLEQNKKYLIFLSTDYVYISGSGDPVSRIFIWGRSSADPLNNAINNFINDPSVFDTGDFIVDPNDVALKMRTGTPLAPGSNLPTDIKRLNANTKFLGVQVTGASSTVNFDIGYFLDTTEFTSSDTRIDYIGLNIASDTNTQFDLVNKIILPLVDGQSTTTLVSNVFHPDGTYTATANFYNLTYSTPVFTNSRIVVLYTVLNGLVTSVYSEAITDINEVPDPGIVEYQDCSISNPFGCLVNAFIYTLVPQPGTFDKFTGLYELVENKPPFGYVSGIIESLSGVNASTTPAFDFGNVPFISQIFDPLKLLFAIGLWVIYSFFFMGRLSKIQL